MGRQSVVDSRMAGHSELTVCPLMTPGGLRDTHRDTQ